MNRIECLNAVEIFRDLSITEIEALSQEAPIRKIPAGNVFFQPDATPDTLYMLSAGRVKLYKLSVEGKEIITGFLEPGVIFGEMGIMGQTLFENYAQAATDVSLCIMLQDDVQRLLLSDIRIANRIIRHLGQRLMDVEYQLSILALKRVPERVASALLRIAGQVEVNKIPNLLTITHEDLAKYVNAHRETVTKVLNLFQDEGYIRLHRGAIELLNPEQLQMLAI
jgi:CRP/FNR family cyclic AMP-dependent transcriptional regulator